MSIERTRETMLRNLNPEPGDVRMLAQDVDFTIMATDQKHQGPDAVPPGLRDPVLRLLAEDPAARPASAGEVISALRVEPLVEEPPQQAEAPAATVGVVPALPLAPSPPQADSARQGFILPVMRSGFTEPDRAAESDQRSISNPMCEGGATALIVIAAGLAVWVLSCTTTTPEPAGGATWTSPADGMVQVYVPAGASPYGALDMAYNAWEWVADWYDARYYGGSANRNPTGPDSGNARVFRGGSFTPYQGYIRAATRLSRNPGVSIEVLGIRCTRSP